MATLLHQPSGRNQFHGLKLAGDQIDIVVTLVPVAVFQGFQESSPEPGPPMVGVDPNIVDIDFREGGIRAQHAGGHAGGIANDFLEGLITEGNSLVCLVLFLPPTDLLVDVLWQEVEEFQSIVVHKISYTITSSKPATDEIEDLSRHS